MTEAELPGESQDRLRAETAAGPVPEAPVPEAAAAVEAPVPEAPPQPRPAARMAPVSLQERFEFLDVLRGCALFGILAANMRGFFEVGGIYFGWRRFYTWTPDVVAQSAIDTFIQYKFVTLFSLMFGMGFAIQMSRSEARGVKPGSFYPRRLAALAGFGMLHIFCIWWGDILVSYALAGLVLFLFRKAKLGTLLVWSYGLWMVPIVAMCVGLVIHDFQAAREQARNAPPRQTTEEKQKKAEEWRTERDRTVREYRSRNLVRIQKQRFAEGRHAVFTGEVVGGAMFAFLLFIPGLTLWKSGLVEHLEAHRRTLRKVFLWALPLGLTGALAATAWDWFAPPAMREQVSFTMMLMQFMPVYAALVLAAGYASGLALLWLRSDAWRARLRPFAAVGRTALTNYLAQSLVCTTFFFATTLYGRIGPLWGLPATLGLYAVQVAISNWWLRRYRYGPLEYVWRILTYGRIPPMRLEPAPAEEIVAP